MRALKVLFGDGLITQKLYDLIRNKIDNIFDREKMPLQKRGRKKKDKPRMMPAETCRRYGCNNLAVEGQLYCCKEHSPYGSIY